MTTLRCAYCADEFPNPIRRGHHVRYHHPEHRNRGPGFLRNGPTVTRPARDTLKRDTDVWPGRP